MLRDKASDVKGTRVAVTKPGGNEFKRSASSIEGFRGFGGGRTVLGEQGHGKERPVSVLSITFVVCVSGRTAVCTCGGRGRGGGWSRPSDRINRTRSGREKLQSPNHEEKGMSCISTMTTPKEEAKSI